MPMSKNYFAKQSVLALWCFLAISIFNIDTLSAQGLTCTAELQASLSDSCRVEIDASTYVRSLTASDVLDYTLIVTPIHGDESGVYTSSGIAFVAGTIGPYIRFTKPGSFMVSVKDTLTGVSCWGTIHVEDKLPPRLVGECECPDEVGVAVSEECTFNCASLATMHGDTSYTSDFNPVFRDNCDSIVPVSFYDRIEHDTICGNAYLVRSWTYSYYDVQKGKFIQNEIGCRQRFLFESIDMDSIKAPKSTLVVGCNIDPDPSSLREHLLDSLHYPTAHADSVIACVYPYIKEPMTGQFSPLGISNNNTLSNYCKILAGYKDSSPLFIDPDCPSAYKIIRTWTVLNWCDGMSEEFTQIIAFMDTEAPRIVVEDTLQTANINPWTCGSDFIVPAPLGDYSYKANVTVIDSMKVASTDSVMVKLETKDGDTVWVRLPLAVWEYDTMNVERYVNVAPGPLYDNCSHADSIRWRAYVDLGFYRIEANKSNGYRLSNLEPGWYDVVYEVDDGCGNIARDTSHLTVADGADPIVILRDKIHVTFTQDNESCVAKVYPNHIDQGSYDACDHRGLKRHIRRMGDTVWHDFVKFTEDDIMGVSDDNIPYGEHLIEFRAMDADGNSSFGMTTIRVEDKNGQFSYSCDDSDVHLNCEISLDEVVLNAEYAPQARYYSCDQREVNIDYRIINEHHNSCALGRVEVAYFVEGNYNDTLCIRTFHFGDNTDLLFDYPPAEIITDCLDNVPHHEIVAEGETGCHKLATSVSDREFEVPSGLGYCKKIIRTYTILDWCVYEPNSTSQNGLYTFTQIIKITDDQAPELTCIAADNIVASNCEASGFKLMAIATDNGSCTSDLSWQAHLDTDGDGTFETTLTIDEVVGGKATATVTQSLTAGNYQIRWTVTDDCGNSDSVICNFAITANHQMPQCVDEVMEIDITIYGYAHLQIEEYIAQHPEMSVCGGAAGYSFSNTDRYETIMSLSCDDLPNGVSATVHKKLYLWNTEGPVDSCTVPILLTDSHDICPDENGGSAMVSGLVHTSDHHSVESAKVTLSASSTLGSLDVMTGVEGSYMLDSDGYQDFEINVTKNDDPANGVSTLDLVLIQQHILGLRPFDNGLTWLAADVNQDQKVSAADLVEIRKLILGRTLEFSSEMSWDFIAENQALDINPFELYNMIKASDITHDMTDQNFLAIKLGDVNGNAIANSAIAGTRSNSFTTLTLFDTPIETSEKVRVEMGIEAEQVEGFQIQLALRSIVLHQVYVNDQLLDDALYSVSDDRLTISSEWLRSQSGNLSIELFVEGLQSGMASEMISLVEKTAFDSEVYVGGDLEVLALNWEVDGGTITNEQFDIYQNKPNPFTGQTSIGFYIGKSGTVDLSIFDVTGKQIYQVRSQFSAGQNEFLVDSEELDASKGVLYYQISADDFVATKKMIRL